MIPVVEEWDGGYLVRTLFLDGDVLVIRDSAGMEVERRPATAEELDLAAPVPTVPQPEQLAEQLASAQQQLEAQQALIDALAARLGIDLTTLTPLTQ